MLVADTTPKQRLLDAAIEYVAANGMSDVSLRTLAAALGTSHRMLIFHFGSKEGLWVEIIRAVEQRQRELLGQVLPDPSQPVGEAMRAWWKHISDPSLWPNERLFFEIYGQALQGRPHTPSYSTGSSTTGSTRSPRSMSRSGSRDPRRVRMRGSASR